MQLNIYFHQNSKRLATYIGYIYTYTYIHTDSIYFSYIFTTCIFPSAAFAINSYRIITGKKLGATHHLLYVAFLQSQHNFPVAPV